MLVVDKDVCVYVYECLKFTMVLINQMSEHAIVSRYPLRKGSAGTHTDGTSGQAERHTTHPITLLFFFQEETVILASQQENPLNN